MSITAAVATITAGARRAARRLRAEDGFSMLIALGTLTVSTLLVSAGYIVVNGDVHVNQRDLDSKRAYYAARAGMNTYLYDLNQDPTHYWTVCANNTQALTAMPGTTTGEYYSFTPVLANGSASCTTDPIKSLIDSTTGMLTIQFTGSAGPLVSGTPSVSRVLVASFKMASPLDYLWYTKYEALSSAISGYSTCGQFYRVTPARPIGCNIKWVTGDIVNGPMYTQDQFMIQSGNSPTFGSSSSDTIASAVPLNTPLSAICTDNSCGSASIVGQATPNAGTIPLPPDNSELKSDASTYGVQTYGTTTITFNGNSATALTCTTVASASCASQSIDMTMKPIIYVNNAACYSSRPYTPFGVTYPTVTDNPYKGNYYGCAGDVYVSGNYTTAFTIAAANDIVITNNVTTTPGGTALPTGGAVLGLVADDFVRVQHGVTGRSGTTSGDCNFDSQGHQGATDVAAQTHANLVIDAAILNLTNSFIVDNYDCGSPLGNLTVNGSIIQNFRGTVGTSRQPNTGYLKKYTYDRRLLPLLPPFLFDISGAPWHPTRETLCVPNGQVAATTCVS